MSSSYQKRAQLKMKSEAWGSRVNEKALKKRSEGKGRFRFIPVWIQQDDKQR